MNEITLKEAKSIIEGTISDLLQNPTANSETEIVVYNALFKAIEPVLFEGKYKGFKVITP